MAKGITIEAGSPRTLNLEGVEVATGGNANQAGLYAVGSKLYLDGEEIADASGAIGLLISNGELTYNGEAVGGGTPTPPAPTSRLWIPPTQTGTGSRNRYTYREYIANYDALMTSSNYPGTIKKYEYRETQDGTITLENGRGASHVVPNMVPSFTEAQSGAFNDVSGAGYGNTPLYHYEFTPSGGYTKTYILEAGIHAGEKDAPQTLLNMMTIFCNKCNENAYARLRPLRDNARFIVIPVVSAYSHDHWGNVGDLGRNDGYNDVYYTDWNGESKHLNPNRNGDFNHEYALSSGNAGNYPWQIAETRHIKAIVERTGPKNINYLFDFHDGGGVNKHFWFNYNMDAPTAQMTRQLLADIIEYEESLIAQGGYDYRCPLDYKVYMSSNGTDRISIPFTWDDTYVHRTRQKLQFTVTSENVTNLNAHKIIFGGSSYLVYDVYRSRSGVANVQAKLNTDTEVITKGSTKKECIITGSNQYQNPYDLEVGDVITAYVVPQADSHGWLHPNVADQGGYSTGTINAWAGIGLGIPASGPEYIGGIFGYNFNDAQATRSLRNRINLLIYAYEYNIGGWRVNEAADADYFHWDYGKAMTRQGLRKDAVDFTASYTLLTIAQVYARWDALTAANPTYITKSASLGQNSGGTDIYSYTLGNGSKKVLFLGGTMRWLAKNTITEFGMYLLAEYLCDDYIVNQSAFLQRLKNDYTIVVLPCIDVNAGGAGTKIGLNSMPGSLNKWKISDAKCVPTDYGSGCEDVGVFTNWIAQQTGALIMLSGGEDTSWQASETPRPDTQEGYTTSYMTQFILPKNVTLDWLDGYCNHLEDDRGEDAPDVDHTNGKTSGDYAYDNIGIKTVYMNLKVSNMWSERKQYAQANDNEERYMYRNYETGRRIANIVNIFLMAGGDIADGGGLVNKND